MAFISVVPVTILLIVGTLILVIGIILNPVFVDILESEFKTLIPLTNHSTTLSTWKDPGDSVDMYMKFYFWDLQNPEEVAKGAKPSVVQKGPYIYQEVKIKQNLEWDTENSKVTFRSPRSWIFNSTLSGKLTENDTFTTINVPLIAVVTLIDSVSVGEEIIQMALKTGLLKNEPTFKRLTVHDLLWGYKDTMMTDIAALLKILKIKAPPGLPLDGNFGFFYKKNGTDDGLYTVKTGQDGLDQFMQITEWNHNKSIPYWKTKYCNMINGTDGTMYHPFIKKTDTLSIFSSDLCRSIDVVYESMHYLEDVPQYRYKPPSTLFGYPPDNDNNACYCVGQKCPHAGVLNISACQSGAPVFVSQPHFLNGDFYKDTVIGMSPNESIHNTFIDVEPTTGIVMKGAKRLQMNLAITPNPYIQELNQIPDMLFPLLWLEESAQINDKGMKTFKDEFFNIQKTVTMVSFLLIAIGAVVDLFTIIYIITKWRQSRKPKNGEKTPLLDGKQQPAAVRDEDKDWSNMMSNQQST